VGGGLVTQRVLDWRGGVVYDLVTLWVGEPGGNEPLQQLENGAEVLTQPPAVVFLLLRVLHDRPC
jgi:hypothetical protein